MTFRTMLLVAALAALGVTGCATTILKEGTIDCGKSEAVWENTGEEKSVDVTLDSTCPDTASVASVRKDQKPATYLMRTPKGGPIEGEGLPVPAGAAVEVSGGNYKVEE